MIKKIKFKKKKKIMYLIKMFGENKYINSVKNNKRRSVFKYFLIKNKIIIICYIHYSF